MIVSVGLPSDPNHFLFFSPLSIVTDDLVVYRHISTKSFGVRNRQDAYAVVSTDSLIFGKCTGGLHLSVLVWATQLL